MALRHAEGGCWQCQAIRCTSSTMTGEVGNGCTWVAIHSSHCQTFPYGFDHRTHTEQASPPLPASTCPLRYVLLTLGGQRRLEVLFPMLQGHVLECPLSRYPQNRQCW